MARLQQINIIENEFKDIDDFLQWREKILQNYTQSKIDYQKELETLLDIPEKPELKTHSDI